MSKGSMMIPSVSLHSAARPAGAQAASDLAAPEGDFVTILAENTDLADLSPAMILPPPDAAAAPLPAPLRPELPVADFMAALAEGGLLPPAPQANPAGARADAPLATDASAPSAPPPDPTAALRTMPNPAQASPLPLPLPPGQTALPTDVATSNEQPGLPVQQGTMPAAMSWATPLADPVPAAPNPLSIGAAGDSMPQIMQGALRPGPPQAMQAQPVPASLPPEGTSEAPIASYPGSPAVAQPSAAQNAATSLPDAAAPPSPPQASNLRPSRPAPPTEPRPWVDQPAPADAPSTFPGPARPAAIATAQTQAWPSPVMPLAADPPPTAPLFPDTEEGGEAALPPALLGPATSLSAMPTAAPAATSGAASSASLPPALLQDILTHGTAAENGPVTVQLRPEELGTLHFQVTRTAEGLHLHLVVDQPATHDLLRRHADDLLAELQRNGFAGTTLSFAGSNTGGGSEPGGGGDGRWAAPPSPALRADGGGLSPASRSTATGTLDLRL